MSRIATFETEEVGGMRGLTALTEPDQDEPVGAIVDVAVIGARGDGKTQFIVHAIRTLRAYAPLLQGAEHQYNRDVLQVVMNAREPRPEATAPGVIPHYVFRIRPGSLLSQVGTLGRLALYARVAGLWRFVLLALVNAAIVAGALTWLRGGLDAAIITAAVGLLGLGTVIGAAFARRRFVRRGDIEIVFWDVAGEHVYSGSAADYYSFLGALVRKRRERASAERSYAFAPVLICNPVSLGTRVEGSSYARLKQLMPLFASLNEPLPRAMVAINRWSVVQTVCAPDSDREQIVAVASQARSSDDQAEQDGERDDAPRAALPAVKREVVRKHCLDAEDGIDNDVHLSYLRYDAGIQCEFRERAWNWNDLEAELAPRWRAPTSASPDAVLEYSYEEGPGSFTGEVRRAFLEWLAALAFHEASYGPERARAHDDDHEEVAFARQAARPAARPADRQADRQAEKPVARPPAQVVPDAEMTWTPKPLSATGLEEFARGTIAREEAVSAAIDASLDRNDNVADDSDEDENENEGEGEGEDRGEFRRESTAPGIGPLNPSKRALTPAPTRPSAAADDTVIERVAADDTVIERAAADDTVIERVTADDTVIERAAADDAGDSDSAAEPGRRHTSTLRMPGGFGSGGT